jgi:prepilin-type N-terminal cleavage/methylation domain-containing protein
VGCVRRAEQRARRRRVPAGLTLVELLVVLVLLGVMAAAVVPALDRGARTGSGVAVQAVEAVLAASREVAVARGAMVTVTIDVETGTWVVTASAHPADPGDTVRTGRLPLGDQARIENPPGGHASFTFDPLGRARGPDLVIGEPGSRHELRIDPWTGRTRRP